MYEQLRKHILPEMIPPGSNVMIAVSGGPDSMALSHLLWRYTQDEASRGITLVLTHVHHGVRKESDDEAIMVQAMAKKWNLPCIVHRFKAKEYAERVGKSFQEAAREWRYARWKEDMSKEKCSLLATAHHLGDQAETILYRLLRGSGTSGLAGIYPRKGTIIRPLLSFSKAEIMEYCREEGIPYSVDHSNEEPVYVRNKIRLELIPELEENYNARIQETLGHTGELLRWDEDYISRQVEDAWKKYSYRDSEESICLRRDVFEEPQAILSRLIRKAAMKITQEPRGLGFTYVTMIMEAREKIGWSQDLPGVRVKVTKNDVRFCRMDKHLRETGREAKNISRKSVEFNIPLAQGKPVRIPGLDMVINVSEGKSLLSGDALTKKEGSQAVFNEELIDLAAQMRLMCRTRQEGDKMWFKNLGHKSLKKVFQEAGIGREVRDRIPLIATGKEILWIPGVRQSDLYKVEKVTERTVCLLVAQPVQSV